MSSSDRILRLLEHVVSADAPLTQSELADAAELPRSTAFNLLSDLRRLGFVDLVDRRYIAGYRLLSLGSRITHSSHLLQRMRPILEQLSAETGETILLMVETGATAGQAGELFLVDQVESSHPVRFIAEKPGARPIYPAAAGKVILAFSNRGASSLPDDVLVRHTDRTVLDRAEIDAELERIRRRGYGTNVDERIEGMTGVAAPVLDPRGAVVGAVTVVGPTKRLRQPAGRVWPLLRDALAQAR